MEQKMPNIGSDDECPNFNKLLADKYAEIKSRCAGPGKQISLPELQNRRTVESFVLGSLVLYCKITGWNINFTIRFKDSQLVISFHISVMTPAEVFVDFDSKLQNVSVYVEQPRGRQVTDNEMLDISDDLKKNALDDVWELVRSIIPTIPVHQDTSFDTAVFAIHDALFRLMSHITFADISFNTIPSRAKDMDGDYIGFYLDVNCFTSTHKLSSGVKFLFNEHNYTLTPTVWCGMMGKELPSFTDAEMYKKSFVNKIVRVFYQYLKVVKNELYFENLESKGF